MHLKQERNNECMCLVYSYKFFVCYGLERRHCPDVAIIEQSHTPSVNRARSRKSTWKKRKLIMFRFHWIHNKCFRKHEQSGSTARAALTRSPLRECVQCSHVHLYAVYIPQCQWGAYYCYYCPLNIILSVCITLQNAYQWLAGRSVYSEELIAFYALCEECFREKMYHDPLNTQIMIAIERFHLFSPAAKQKLKHQQHRRCE